jgi:translin
MSLDAILEKLEKNFKTLYEVHEQSVGNSRKITKLSKQAIMAIHIGDHEKAEAKLSEAKALIDETKKMVESYPEFIGRGSLYIACEEYAEAQILLNLIKQEVFLDPETIDVPPTSYILGLADVIGELRRRALDSIRRDELSSAEICLRLMEEIYIGLMSMENAYNLAQGLRRKCDVARHLIETTRSDITLESRMKLLKSSIDSFKKL